MDSPREYIKDVLFFDDDELECRVSVIETNLFRYKITASTDPLYLSPKIVILDEEFDETYAGSFIDAELFYVSDNLDELKLNELFHKSFERDLRQRYPMLNGYYLFVKFETSEGDFYILAIDNDCGPYRSALDFTTESLD